MMMQLACDCDANHKAAAVMDGLRDRLRLLVWGAFTNTYFLFDPCDPLIAFIQSPDAAQYPHQLPMTPHHSPASACHVLGVKGSPLSFLRMEPPIPCPAHNQSLGGQRWIGAPHDPIPSAEDPLPLQRAAVTNV